MSNKKLAIHSMDWFKGTPDFTFDSEVSFTPPFSRKRSGFVSVNNSNDVLIEADSIAVLSTIPITDDLVTQTDDSPVHFMVYVEKTLRRKDPFFHFFGDAGVGDVWAGDAGSF